VVYLCENKLSASKMGIFNKTSEDQNVALWISDRKITLYLITLLIHFWQTCMELWRPDALFLCTATELKITTSGYFPDRIPI